MSVTYTFEAPVGANTVVQATFTSDDPAITHERSVNAVYSNGVYDSVATDVRVSEVAMGVEHKIAVGVIS